MPYARHGLGYRRMDTAHDAAEGAARFTKRFHAEIIAALKSKGPMTADETASAIGASVLSIRPRFTELASGGAIVDTGERRHNESGRRAAVWGLAE